MRGARRTRHRRSGDSRIIPADAGSTRNDGPEIVVTGDHPRGCREHDPETARFFATRGSSPRMRGALALLPTGEPQPRIIPADAGST